MVGTDLTKPAPALYVCNAFALGLGTGGVSVVASVLVASVFLKRRRLRHTGCIGVEVFVGFLRKAAGVADRGVSCPKIDRRGCRRQKQRRNKRDCPQKSNEQPQRRHDADGERRHVFLPLPVSCVYPLSPGDCMMSTQKRKKGQGDNAPCRSA